MSGETYFPGQQEHEQFLFFFRKHWIELLYPVGRFLTEQLFVFLFVFFMIFNGSPLVHTGEGEIAVLLVILTLLVSVLTFWVRIFNYFLRIVIVTDYRVIDVKQKLFVTDDVDVIDLWEVQDLKGETHGFWNNIIGCGMITFVLTASSLVKVLHNVPHTREVLRRMSEAREMAKQVRPQTQASSIQQPPR
jgi:hypothetical protein